ncbi:hypothetical protein TSUD_386510 [Trifolium subterraneum]|uniref:Reverse transcriptase zinc-binding domain-containing protein n=1 Tax=Trifolium subterraneum TaxID=3900 RepID=A0A2Z6MLV0_TRISU|nr:hypothetical protein TSUD_386510 [Trifolium subterraneum]
MLKKDLRRFYPTTSKDVAWIALLIIGDLAGCGDADAGSLVEMWYSMFCLNDNALWKEVIRGKYGGAAIGRIELGDDCKPWFSSNWWRDICSIGSNLDQDWFSRAVVKKMGNATVASVRNLNNEIGWELVWRRRLFVWETNLLNELLMILNPITLSDAVDQWGWRPENGEEFSVKSTYSLVYDMLLTKGNISQDQESAFKAIWKGPAPFKVSGFAWLVLLDKVPTRVNLIRRRAIQENGENRCIFCGDYAETVNHLFLYRNCIVKIWLGLNFMFPHSTISLLNLLASTPGCKQRRKGMLMIWNAVIWSVWCHCNRAIFENGLIDLAGVLDDIKTTSWRWSIGRSKAPPCLFYEWNSEPVICMAR